MITLDELLNEGPLFVKGNATMLSAIRATGGAIGISAYDEGQPRPTNL